MARIVRIKNNSGAEDTWVGQTIADGAYHNIDMSELSSWNSNHKVFDDVSCNKLIVNKGADTVEDIADPILGWNWLQGDTTPYSELGNKMAVHASTKPDVPGKEFYLVWTGAGDDINNHLLGEGDLLTFDFAADDPVLTEKSKDIRFDPTFGDVYLHEGYMKHTGADACGPVMTALIMCDPSPLLDHTVSLDLVIEDDWVKYSPTGPGTGTHGFAGTPVLMKRSYMHDGDWNYDPTSDTPLTPNFTGDGEYKISSIERVAHKYINRIPICGHQPVARLTSDETAYLPPGYFIRITCTNPNADPLKAAFFFEVYRERTAVP